MFPWFHGNSVRLENKGLQGREFLRLMATAKSLKIKASRGGEGGEEG